MELYFNSPLTCYEDTLNNLHIPKPTQLMVYGPLSPPPEELLRAKLLDMHKNDHHRTNL